MRLVVAVTGATGSVYAVRLLQALQATETEVHLILSMWAKETLRLETSYTEADLHALAARSYEASDLAAPLSSGSYLHQGMVVIPCSMKTMAAIAHGYDDNLIARAADVTIKEGRSLIVVPRETPINASHLENMQALSRMGVVIMPPMPAFYSHPRTIDDLINQFIGRVLDRLGVQHDLAERWGGRPEG